MLLWTSRGLVHVQITPLKREKSCFTLNFTPCFEGLLILEATSIIFGCDALTQMLGQFCVVLSEKT